jgi:hypothetical protein
VFRVNCANRKAKGILATIPSVSEFLNGQKKKKKKKRKKRKKIQGGRVRIPLMSLRVAISGGFL